MTYWKGKRAVITGGSAGLGRAISEGLVRQGARVAIVARGQEQLDVVSAELKALGGEVLSVACDVTLQADVKRLAETIINAWGGLDLLCHCAGKSMRGTVLDTSAEEFRDLWEANFLAAVRCTQAFADSLKASQGHVVLIGSLASKVAPGYLGAYPASKFSVAAFAQQLRIENGPESLHTLLVCPGPIARHGDDVDARRYDDQNRDLPESAHRPGGGAKTRAIEPEVLAAKILKACESRRAELIVPQRARLLFMASQLSPRLGDWLLRKLTSG